MPSVYEARHGFEATLLKDVLAQHGIAAEVRGADLQGAAGNLPVMGLVQVCVDEEQREAACAVLARWEAGELALPDDEPQRPPHPPQRKPEREHEPTAQTAWLLLLPLLAAALWWAWG